MKVEDIVNRLKGVLETTNGWQARCPAHDDDKASLSIGTDGGNTLLYCQAGCKTTDVVRAMGLQMRDLFPDEPQRPTVVATYKHEDDNGKLLYEVLRYNPKDFRARRPDGNGGWVYSLDGTRLVPYHLRTS